MELKERPICTHDIDLSSEDIYALKHCQELCKELIANSVELTVNDKFRSFTYCKEDWEVVKNRLDILIDFSENTKR